MTRLRPAIGRSLLEWLAVTVLCAGLAAVSTAQGWLWRLDGAFYDAAMATRRSAPDPDVIVVAIDDRSLAELGRWPWDRSVHAALLERLAAEGTAAVALDIILHEADRDNPEADAALARAIGAHGRVVLPVTHGTYAAGSDGEELPTAVFADAAAALGHVHIELDPDGIARSLYLWEGQHTPRYPQLALAALGLAAPGQALDYRPPLEDARPGWRRSGWLRIPFAGPPGTARYVSYVDVLKGQYPKGLFHDAVVFVGATAAGLGDAVPTPTSGHARPMPGVEIHATMFGALRRGDGIHALPGWTAGLLAALLVTALMLLMPRSGPRTALLAAFGFAGAALAGAWLVLSATQTWIPPIGAALALMLTYPLWSWRRLEATQAYLDAELAALREAGERFRLVAPAGEAGRPVDRLGARIAMVRDAARRQRDLQRFITDILDSLPVGAVVLGTEGGVRLANRRAAELLGVAEDRKAVAAALAGLPWPPGRAPILPRGERDSEAPPLQLEAELKNGRVVLASVACLLDDAGGPAGTVVGLADITAVREAQRSREETMHFLSHDLRAPLASILTLTESPRPGVGAEADLQGAREPQGLAWIARYARSALNLADDIFRLVRAEGVDPACFSELSLEMLVQDAADEVWALARGKGIRLATVLALPDETEPCLVRGDGDLLCRALVNLLTNAIKYAPEGSSVQIILGAEAGGWAVRVRDEGPGIAEDQQARLFQRFSRLQTPENRRLSGVGLGLLMVRTVAERHGGSVGVESRPGEGSTFTLRLPAAAAP